MIPSRCLNSVASGHLAGCFTASGPLFKNSTGKGRDLIAANTCGLHVAPIGWSRAWWIPSRAAPPYGAQLAGLEPSPLAPPLSSHSQERDMTLEQMIGVTFAANGMIFLSIAFAEAGI